MILELKNGLITGMTSGTLIATVLGILFVRRSKIIDNQIKKLEEEFRSKRTWKEKSVSDLLAPVCIQLRRTKRAFLRWKEKNLYLEAKVIREANITIHDLLLRNPHLIPPELLDSAEQLIDHYDRWLEEFDKLRSKENPDLDHPFVFVGPSGFPFPQKAEQKFYEVYQINWERLYADEKTP